MRRRALLSVTDKTGIVELARGLVERDIEVCSTGGTARTLREAGLPVTDVAEITGFPEMMDGRLKTLHPKVHGGLLARRDAPAHRQALAEHGIGPIDVLAVNLYAFRETVAQAGVGAAQAIEQIDIGGPAMIRSAAKNHDAVWVLVDPADYGAALAALADEEAAPSRALALRRRLAAKAFATTAAYDAAIAAWFGQQLAEGAAGAFARGAAAEGAAGAEPPGALGAGRNAADTDLPGEPDASRLPERLVLDLGPGRLLRYGENPHQAARFHVTPGGREASIAGAVQLGGKELSYNNILDADAALELVKDFARPAVAVIKHTNPCGCGVADALPDAFARAWSGDPLSAFGGILAFNRPVTAAVARAVARPEHFLEIVVAPAFDADALEILRTGAKWGKNVRLLATGPFGAREPHALAVRQVTGGFLVQQRDLHGPERRDVATARPPTPAEQADLEIAWTIAKHVKSNAIVLVKDGTLVGVGAGQMSRVDSVHLAGRKAGERSRGAALASDAFFPFRDSVDQAHALGVTAIIQPGGSVRDGESIEAADEQGLAMVLTGTRHFRH